MLPFQCTLKPSYQLAIWLVLGASLSSVCLFCYVPRLLASLLVTLISIATLYHILHDALRLLPTSLRTIAINKQHTVSVQRRDEQWLALAVHYTSTTVLPGLIVLSLRYTKPNWWQRWQTLHIVVLADSLPVNQRRQLAVWLRWHPQQDVPQNRHIERIRQFWRGLQISANVSRTQGAAQHAHGQRKAPADIASRSQVLPRETSA